MIKRIAPIALLIGLAGCAGPQGDGVFSSERSTGADASVLSEPVIADAPITVTPAAPDTSCEDPGDGIGGTGCSVD